MDDKKREEILENMIKIGDNVDSHLDQKSASRENIIYCHDFQFKDAGIGQEGVYIVEISNQKEKETGDKAKQTEKIDSKDEPYVTYEIYSKEGELIATVNKEGKVKFTEKYLEDLKNIDKKYFDTLNLDDIDFEMPEELRDNDLVMTKEELEDHKEKKQKKGENAKEENEEEREGIEENEEEKEQKQISNKKGIPQHNVLIVRENSNLYKDHPNLEKDLYFYRDTDGIVKAEYMDENGELQPSQYFEESTTSIRQETVEIGNDGNPVVKDVPYQVMKTKNLTEQDKDIRDIRININIDTYGYLEISEARQGMNGEWAAHDIEVKGREYNSHEVNEETSMRTRKANPDRQTDTYDMVDDTGLVQDGIQYDEMYLMQHSDEIIQEFIDEGYNRDEAITIFNYMIGDEVLTEEQAKEKVNEEIQSKEKQQEKGEEDEGRTPWGDAEGRRI